MAGAACVFLRFLEPKALTRTKTMTARTAKVRMYWNDDLRSKAGERSTKVTVWLKNVVLYMLSSSS